MIKLKNLPHDGTFPISFASIKASINLISQLVNSSKMFVFQKNYILMICNSVDQ